VNSDTTDFGRMMVSITRLDCALEGYTFGHEIGHNMGLDHDKYEVVKSSRGRITPYSQGYHIPGTKFRTILAYNRRAQEGNRQRINHYSNPDVKFQDVPTGSNEADAARRITEVRFVIATIGDESQACTTCTTCTPSGGELEPVTATQSSTLDNDANQFGAGNCINGVTDSDWKAAPWGGRWKAICHTPGGPADEKPWIAIDYGTPVTVQRVEIFNRGDCCGKRTRNVEVRISKKLLPTSSSQMFSGGNILGSFAGPASTGQHIVISGEERTGRYVIIQMDNGGDALNLREVKAFGRRRW